MTFTLLQLRIDATQILTNTQYLGEYIGFSSGNKPAVCVLPDDVYGYNYPPKQIQVNKIELVIMKPQTSNKFTFGTDLIQRVKYKVCLKQWEVIDEQSQVLLNPPRLREATQELYEQLNLKGYELEPVVYSGKSEKLGILETSYITVYCTQLACIGETSSP